ncbi:MAG: patatin-like phospholipase family protein, partial [Clostridia bacterium]|nr:patatin-like phospholipase family protein [Clostridia bacterium]
MKIGLVLSGGMAKGAYQIGALKAIEEFIPFGEIEYISGASIGVLNGYAYATGQLDLAQKLWKNCCGSYNRSLITRVLRDGTIPNAITGLQQNGQVPGGVFYAALLDMTKKTLVYQNLASADAQDMVDLLCASVAVPACSKGVAWNGGKYFDGAAVDNIPVFPLMKHELDYIICVYFDEYCYTFENSCFDDRVIKVTFSSDSILAQSLVLTRERVSEMIDEGYFKTKEILTAAFEKGYEDTEYVRSVIPSINSRYG